MSAVAPAPLPGPAAIPADAAPAPAAAALPADGGQPRSVAYLGDGLSGSLPHARAVGDDSGGKKGDSVSLPVPQQPASPPASGLLPPFLQRVLNRKNRERNFAEEYKNLRLLIRSRFKHSKLNLRRAEVYVKVQKVNLEAMELYRELVVYLAFTVMFFWLVVHVIPLNVNNYQDSSLTAPGAFLNFVQLGSDQTAFLAMNNVEEFYAYVNDTLLPLLDVESADSFAWFRKRVGTLRLRQVRVKGFPCSQIDPRTMRSLDNTTCFSDFQTSADDRADEPRAGRVGWGASFSELSTSEKYLRDGSATWSYGTGGFVVDLPPDLAGARAALTALAEAGWVDEATRAITVSFALQNPHTGTYTVADMIAEMPPSGLLFPSVNINTIRLQPLERRDDAVFVVGVIFLIFVIGYILSEMKQAGDMGIVLYFRDAWNAWDIADLAMIVVLYFRYGEFVTFSRSMAASLASSPDPARFYDFGRGVALVTEMQQIAGIAILITCIRIFKFFELNPRLSVLTNTVGKAVPDLSAFLLIFVILFAGYAFMAWVMFGYKVDDFSSFYASFSTLFSNLGGGFNFVDLADAAPGGAVVFFFSFVVVVSLVLINIFIAIVNKYYGEAGDTAVKVEEEFVSALDEEDRMSVLRKFTSLAVTVQHLSPETGELEEGKTSHDAEKGSIVRIWLATRESSSRAPGTRPATAARGGAGRPISAPTRRVRAHLQSTVHYTPSLECIAQGKAMWTRFLREVIDRGDRLYLRSSGKSGVFPRSSCPLRVAKLSNLDGGVYVDCVVTHRAAVPNGAALELSRWTSFKRIVALYGMSPSVMQAYRAIRFFGEFNIPRAPAILKDELIEERIMEISRRNQELRNKAAGERRRESYRLDDMLWVIRHLEIEAHNKNIPGMNEERVGHLVYEALHIDALYKRLNEISKSILGAGRAAGAGEAPGATRSGSTHELLERANQTEDGVLKEVSRVYGELSAAAEAFDRRVEELYRNAAGEGGSYIVEGLRFDEVCDLIRDMLIRSGRTGFDEIDIKKEAIRFLSSFPNSCFDALVVEQERGEAYVPRPYDTSEIADSDRDPKKVLSKLVLTLGAVVHDAWSMSKLDGGWRYGPNRDNASKMHNCLKPFDELSDEERAYDVDMAIQILRAVIFFGYDLVPPEGADAGGSGASSLVPVPGQDRFPGALKPGYTLRQIDVSGVKESDDVMELIELLAKNAHDLWAKKRKEEGWTYSEALNDRKKQHNLLVPYELLTEDEKKNDLNTVRSTIQSVLALGWRIVPRKQKRTFRMVLRDILGV